MNALCNIHHTPHTTPCSVSEAGSPAAGSVTLMPNVTPSATAAGKATASKVRGIAGRARTGMVNAGGGSKQPGARKEGGAASTMASTPSHTASSMKVGCAQADTHADIV